MPISTLFRSPAVQPRFFRVLLRRVPVLRPRARGRALFGPLPPARQGHQEGRQPHHLRRRHGSQVRRFLYLINSYTYKSKHLHGNDFYQFILNTTKKMCWARPGKWLQSKSVVHYVWSLSRCMCFSLKVNESTVKVLQFFFCHFFAISRVYTYTDCGYFTSAFLRPKWKIVVPLTKLPPQNKLNAKQRRLANTIQTRV